MSGARIRSTARESRFACSASTAPARPPPQTQAGQPLRPWTIPNAIGFARLALMPVFLVVRCSSSSDGVGAPQATLFAVIGWGDYADGIAARVTGQYSRLGALMDPVTDRLLVISGRGRHAGASSCCRAGRWRCWPRASWRCSRSGATASRRGVELRINWPGRLAVAPVMGSFFFAMAGLGGLGEVLLYVGLALALAASVLYARSWLAQLHAKPEP